MIRPIRAVKSAKTARGTLPPVNAEEQYRRQIERMVKAYHRSLQRRVIAIYRRREDDIIGDASPANEIDSALAELQRKWKRKFGATAERIVPIFIKRVNTHTTNSIKQALKDAGFAIDFPNTREINNILQSLIKENVSLIKSIPDSMHSQVQSIVQIGMQNGRDLEYVREELQTKFGVSERKATQLARDQSNKATQSLTRARYEEAGIEEAVWVHRAVGKTYRKTHVEFNNQTFKINEGLYDDAVKKKVLPGELINCYCMMKPIIAAYKNKE